MFHCWFNTNFFRIEGIVVVSKSILDGCGKVFIYLKIKLILIKLKKSF